MADQQGRPGSKGNPEAMMPRSLSIARVAEFSQLKAIEAFSISALVSWASS